MALEQIFRIIRGQYTYYRLIIKQEQLEISTVSPDLQVIEYAKKWLNRRSQRKSYNWDKFKRVLE